MNENEYTPEGVVSELVPADLTPDAVILGHAYTIEIVWGADVLVHRGPDCAPETWDVFSSGWITPGGTFNELELEESCVEWMAASLSARVEDIEVLTFRWVLLQH